MRTVFIGHLEMIASAVLLLAVAALAAASPVPPDGKEAIAKARKDADVLLMQKLSGVDSSVLRIPRKELLELEDAGKRDQDEIISLAGGKNVSEQLNSSVTFWKNKTEEVIKPYVTHPENYKGMIVDLPYSPPDPDWNTTKEYKEAEEKIRESVEMTITELKKVHLNELEKIKAKKVEDVTHSSWARLLLERLLRSELVSVRNNGQWAKQDAADGMPEETIESDKRDIANCKTEFNTIADNICTEYEKNIKH